MSIIEDHSPIRNLLFPIYCKDQLIFITIISITIGIFFYAHDMPGYIFAVCGWIGGSLVLRQVVPSHMTVTTKQAHIIEERLKKSNFFYQSKTCLWVSPLPRWLQWSNSSIYFNDDTFGNIIVSGPKLYLKIAIASSVDGILN